MRPGRARPGYPDLTVTHSLYPGASMRPGRARPGYVQGPP